RLLYWCPKEKIKNILFWTSGSVKNYDEFPKYKIFDKKKEQLENLLEFFRENKYQVIYKEILEKKIRGKLDGMAVVMVKSPQLQPLYLKESLPAFGGKRIKEVPLKIGVKSVKQLNLEPHPFA
ncbi:MAG: hypothetical protein IIB83_05235, partial [Bacteroidetes bacterium]|nr:hypothetical protein [Bacteroidota bacterium]